LQEALVVRVALVVLAVGWEPEQPLCFQPLQLGTANVAIQVLHTYVSQTALGQVEGPAQHDDGL